MNILALFAMYTWMILWTVPQQQWFVLDNQEATQIANYMRELNPDPIMLAVFMQESWLNPRSQSKTSDRWICQLHYQRGFNKDVIDDPRRTDWKWQSEQCVWKRQNAQHTQWNGFKSGAYKKYLYLFEWGWKK